MCLLENTLLPFVLNFQPGYLSLYFAFCVSFFNQFFPSSHIHYPYFGRYHQRQLTQHIYICVTFYDTIYLLSRWPWHRLQPSGTLIVMAHSFQDKITRGCKMSQMSYMVWKTRTVNIFNLRVKRWMLGELVWPLSLRAWWGPSYVAFGWTRLKPTSKINTVYYSSLHFEGRKHHKTEFK